MEASEAEAKRLGDQLTAAAYANAAIREAADEAAQAREARTVAVQELEALRLELERQVLVLDGELFCMYLCRYYVLVSVLPCTIFRRHHFACIQD